MMIDSLNNVKEKNIRVEVHCKAKDYQMWFQEWKHTEYTD